MQQRTSEIREGLEAEPVATSVVVEQRDAVTVISLVGEHDMTTADELTAAVNTAAARGQGVVVTLAETTFVDSAIVHRLYKGDRRMLGAGRRLVLHVGAEPVVDRVLEIGGLLDELMWSVALEDAVVFAGQSDGRDVPVDQTGLTAPLMDQVVHTVRDMPERDTGL